MIATSVVNYTLFNTRASKMRIAKLTTKTQSPLMDIKKKRFKEVFWGVQGHLGSSGFELGKPCKHDVSRR